MNKRLVIRKSEFKFKLNNKSAMIYTMDMKYIKGQIAKAKGSLIASSTVL